MRELLGKDKLLGLMTQLVEDRDEAEIRDLNEQIKDLLGKGGMGSIYKKEDGLNCHAALDFFKAAGKGFLALAGDLKETEGKLDAAKDSRRPVLRALRAKMKRLVEEMKEACHIINRINRF